tara:strand:- start:43 stop:174 length:132 start_codon:yes stop_codon:yes gene_type:complete
MSLTSYRAAPSRVKVFKQQNRLLGRFAVVFDIVLMFFVFFTLL